LIVVDRYQMNRRLSMDGVLMAAKTLAKMTGPVLCCAPLAAAPLDEGDAAELARAFAALGDPARLRILSLLASATAGEVCVCDLVDPVGRSQPTVSHHLKVLSDAGLIEGDKRGRWVWYRVVPARLAQLRDVLA
jgi:ArsR family transcriptional regulator